MGCIKGASDYFEYDVSTSLLFGLTGHAFLINIHEKLCPSGPYVWKKDRFESLLRQIGIDVAARFTVNKETSETERSMIESELKAYLDKGYLRMLDFLEHQLAAGYDANDTWSDAVFDGMGESHGNWWNGSVWSECRKYASGFFSEAADLPEIREIEGIRRLFGSLSRLYGEISEDLSKAKEKEHEAERGVAEAVELL